MQRVAHLAMAAALLSGATACSQAEGVSSREPITSATVADLITSTVPTTPSTVATSSSTSTSTSAAPAALRLMELGDSITARTDFRQPLARKLAAAGCTVQSVGSVKLDPTDSANEGHGGLRADQIADGTRAWVAAAKPDIVLVHVGTNDFYQSQDVASTVVDTRRIVSEIQAAAPKAQTYVARIIPGGGIEAQTQALGAEVALLDNGSTVHVVDQFSDVRPTTDTVDGAHPTPALGEKMAERWFNAIRPAVASACKA